MATKKKSLKQRLKERKKELQKRGGNRLIVRQADEGTIRMRVLPVVGEEAEFVQEVLTFWVNDSLVFSPETYGDACALMETFKELKASDDEDDNELAKKLIPRSKFLAPVLIYKDDRGKKVDEEHPVPALFQLTRGIYEGMIDLFLDEDEWGDMTDPKRGYDIKITRTGKGKTDTNYSIQPCKNTPLPPKYRKPIDLEALVKTQIDSYEKTAEARDKFLGNDSEEDEEEEKPKRKLRNKKKKVSSKKKKTRSKRRSDI